MQNSTPQVFQQDLFDPQPVMPASKEKPKAAASHLFDLADALRAPVLTFSQQCADAIPKRLFGILPVARTKALLLGESLATYAECTIYLYTRTLEAPIDNEWTDIYTHVSCQTLQEYFNEDHWDAVNAPPTLTEWLQSKLHRLRRLIYDKRREILHTQLKQEERANQKNSPGTTPTRNDTQQTLLSK